MPQADDDTLMPERYGSDADTRAPQMQQMLMRARYADELSAGRGAMMSAVRRIRAPGYAAMR